MLRTLLRAAKSKKTIFAAGLLTALALLVGAGTLGANQASAAYCGDANDNAIIYCGFDKNKPEDYIAQLNKNQSHPGGNPNHTDIKAIAKAAGLEEKDYDRFIKESRLGYVDINGDIWVDGQKVATGTRTFGRWYDWHSGTGYQAWPIPGTNTTLHGNFPKRSFGPHTTQIPVRALFDRMGNLQFVVETPCGNVMKYTKVEPEYKCDLLHADLVSGTTKTYNFWTDAHATGNASIDHIEYYFGDHTGMHSVDKPGPNGKYAITYTYEEAKSYTVVVTVYVKLPGGNSTSITPTPGGGCVKEVVVPQYSCVLLKAIYIDKEKMKIQLQAKATMTGGATFTGADFDFGDGTKQNGVKPDANGVTATTSEYTYAKSGNYSAKAVLYFSVNGETVTAPTCTARITPTESKPECKPGVPVGDPLCEPCEYDASLPNDPKTCKPPELPNTGAGNTIALVSAVAIGGFLVYRQLLFRKHKAEFEAAQMGTSLLPLGDPLDSEAPLHGTPLETNAQKRSFRRKRQF